MSEMKMKCEGCGKVVSSFDGMLSHKCKPNTPASDQPERPTCFTQECAIGLHSACDGGVPFSTGMIPCRCECHRSDQPEYRPLGPDEVIGNGTQSRPRGLNGAWLSDFAWRNDKVKDHPDYEFRRPIAAEKREDTRTCGELSCDECNERYQKAIAEISTLQQQLAQEKEEKIATERQAEIYRQETHRWKEALHKTETDRDNLREALNRIRYFPVDSEAMGSALSMQDIADKAIQQSEGK